MALCLFLLGCQDSKFCTLIGFESHVRVDASDRIVVRELCLDGECAGPFGDGALVAVDDEPAMYDYELTFVDGTGVERVVAGELRTEEYFVNGEGCDPRTANAILRIDENGNVTVDHRGR